MKEALVTTQPSPLDRIQQLERDVKFLARGLVRALSGRASFTEQDTERLLELAGEDE
jgi:hypothetical protein